ncbi:hypothetical protein V8C37DRAFT_279303 [Trichoderma ceciliae]
MLLRVRVVEPARNRLLFVLESTLSNPRLDKEGVPDSPSLMSSQDRPKLSLMGERRGKPGGNPMFAFFSYRHNPSTRQPLVGATAVLGKAQIATPLMRGLANTRLLIGFIGFIPFLTCFFLFLLSFFFLSFLFIFSSPSFPFSLVHLSSSILTISRPFFLGGGVNRKEEQKDGRRLKK